MQPKTKSVEPPKRAYYRLTLVGTTPLLYHRRGEILSSYMAGKKLGLPPKPREKWDAVAEFKDCLDTVGPRDKLVIVDMKGDEVESYEGPWGHDIPVYARMKDKTPFVLPANGVKACVVRACKQAGIAMTDAATSISIKAQWLAIEGSDPHMRCDLVRVDNGAPDLRIRAQFDEWKVVVPVVVRRGVWTGEMLAAVAADGGEFVGLHDWRNECGGTFGSFDVESIVETQKGDASWSKDGKKVKRVA